MSTVASWASPAQTLAACLFVVVSTFCLCWFERSRRKTIKEVLPGLTQADPATIREISRLLASSRWQIGQRPTPRAPLPGPPSGQAETRNSGPDQAVS